MRWGADGSDLGFGRLGDEYSADSSHTGTGTTDTGSGADSRSDPWTHRGEVLARARRLYDRDF